MRHRGITLTEVLMMVTALMILASVAVPNYIESQTRSKVARANADMREIAIAIEAYAVDNSAYPDVNQNPGFALPLSSTRSGSRNAGLSTPVAYLAGSMSDPFGGRNMPGEAYQSPFPSSKYYWYWPQEYMSEQSWLTLGPGAEAPLSKWVIMSKGPDEIWAHAGAPQGSSGEVDHPLKWAYDPTNGTISWGNIARCGPQPVPHL